MNSIFSIRNENGKIKVDTATELLSKEYQEQMKVIDLVYETKYFIGMHDNKKYLKPKRDRTCRFCGKSHPEVTFKKIAHIVPELIGNKKLLSDFECDNCNWKFGQYENDLANYLGPFRTFATLPGKKGIPKYKSSDKELAIELAADNVFDVKMKDFSYIDDNIKFERKEKILKIQSKSNPYTPISVYKSLLKSAVSFVDNEDLKYLSDTIKFLMDDNFKVDTSANFMITIHQYFIPGDIKTPPFIIYYRKREKSKKCPAPSMAFIFYIRNTVIQLFIPFHSEDYFFYKQEQEKERKIFIFPPLVPEKWIDQNGTPFSRIEHLNNRTKLKDVVQNIWIKYD